MENKKLQKLSAAALIISILPLMTFIPVLLHITLTDGVRSIWAGANILSVFAGLILSIICVKNRESRNVVNIISFHRWCTWNYDGKVDWIFREREKIVTAMNNMDIIWIWFSYFSFCLFCLVGVSVRLNGVSQLNQLSIMIWMI